MIIWYAIKTGDALLINNNYTLKDISSSNLFGSNFLFLIWQLNIFMKLNLNNEMLYCKMQKLNQYQHMLILEKGNILLLMNEGMIICYTRWLVHFFWHLIMKFWIIDSNLIRYINLIFNYKEILYTGWLQFTHKSIVVTRLLIIWQLNLED